MGRAPAEDEVPWGPVGSRIHSLCNQGVTCPEGLIHDLVWRRSCIYIWPISIWNLCAKIKVAKVNDKPSPQALVPSRPR